MPCKVLLIHAQDKQTKKVRYKLIELIPLCLSEIAQMSGHFKLIHGFLKSDFEDFHDAAKIFLN